MSANSAVTCRRSPDGAAEFAMPSTSASSFFLGLFSLFCYVRELERLGRVFTD
jgi:hypothetical protein